MTNDCKSENRPQNTNNRRKGENDSYRNVKTKNVQELQKKQADCLFFCLLIVSKSHLEPEVAGCYKYAGNQRQYRGKKHDVNNINDKGVFADETD